MANNKIQIKRTNVAGRVPNTTNSSNSMYIAAGEFALNMADKQLYTSNGSSLITIGSSGTSLTLADSLRIGSIESSLLVVNSSSVFTGNANSNTSVNTTSISVQNNTSNTVINPTTIYVGNNVANISLDVTGGIKTIPISTMKINAGGVATIQTTVNHNITLVTQAKLYVNTSQVSMNTANYSSDYNPAGFNILSIPSANSITVNIPTSDFKYRWGDRTITYINRNTQGVVTVVTKGPHLYQNGDKAYTTNVKYNPSKPPFTFLDGSGLPVPSSLTVIDPFTVNYTQSGYSSAGRSLAGATLSLYAGPLTDNSLRTGQKYLQLKAASSLLSDFKKGDLITFSGFPFQAAGPNNAETYDLVGYVAGAKAASPSWFSKTSTTNYRSYTIDSIQYNNDNTILIQMIFATMEYRYRWFFSGSQSAITLSSGSILVDFTDTGTVLNTSQLCPYLDTSSISGEIYATNPTGITIKNGSKLIYVLDSAVYVGNNTIGNIIDVAGSRVFKPTAVETLTPPTFTVQPSVLSLNEGDSVTYTITTSNFGTGTLYWTNSGTVTGADFTDGVNYGTIDIVNDIGYISKTLLNDYTAEGQEQIVFEVRRYSTSGPILTTAATVYVNDTSIQTYNISSDFSYRNEGQTVIFTVTTQGVSDGTVLYYKNIGTTSAADFDDGLNSGSLTITNNSGNITKTIVNDFKSEGQETIIMEIHSSSINGPVVVTSSQVAVLDTSIETYAAVADLSPVGEGYKVTFTVTTQGVPDGTTLFWTNAGTTTAADFYDGINSGSFTISNNIGLISRVIAYDLLTEGSETIIFQVRTQSTSGPIVAYAPTVTVTDTSTSTSTYYGITSYNNSIVSENYTLSYTIYAEVPNNTMLYWTNEGTSSGADLTNGFNSGNIVIQNKYGSYIQTILADGITEGAETFIFALRTGSINGPIVSMSPPVTIRANTT